MAKETKQKNPNISTEAFKLNKEIPVEKEIRDFLDKSNNKSGLIKDALSMYMYMVNVQGYVSPFLQNNTGNWDAIFNNINNNNVNVDNLIGRPAQQVKDEVINSVVAPKDDITKGHEPVVLDLDDDDYYDDEENEENDIDY